MSVRMGVRILGDVVRHRQHRHQWRRRCYITRRKSRCCCALLVNMFVWLPAHTTHARSYAWNPQQNRWYSNTVESMHLVPSPALGESHTSHPSSELSTAFRSGFRARRVATSRCGQHSMAPATTERQKPWCYQRNIALEPWLCPKTGSMGRVVACCWCRLYRRLPYGDHV